MGEKATQAGLDESLKWKACEVSTTESINCGISNYDDFGVGKTQMLAVHNPSTVE